MANEAVLITQVTIPQAFTCSDGAGIEKGTVLTLSDPNTVAAATTTNAVVGGIAYTEKIASDGKTKIAVVRGPGDVFKMTASGAITAGNPVGLCNLPLNQVRDISLIHYLSGAQRFGFAKETAADQETLLVELNIGMGMA